MTAIAVILYPAFCIFVFLLRTLQTLRKKRTAPDPEYLVSCILHLISVPLAAAGIFRQNPNILQFSQIYAPSNIDYVNTIKKQQKKYF